MPEFLCKKRNISLLITLLLATIMLFSNQDLPASPKTQTAPSNKPAIQPNEENLIEEEIASDETAVETSRKTPEKTSAKSVQGAQISQETITKPEETILNEQKQEARVSKVVDGDTLHAIVQGEDKTIRIIGINTPETVDPRKAVQCFGREASQRAKELLLGQTIFLTIDPTQTNLDKYQRLLRYVWLSNGEDFGKKMIKEGFAYEYTYNTPYIYQASYKNAQEEAKNAKRGLWANTACHTN